MKSLLRHLFYVWLWTTPADQIAVVLGRSDTSIGKRARQFDIPTPWRGYWTQVKSGRPVTWTPLPNAADIRALPLQVDDTMFKLLQERAATHFLELGHQAMIELSDATPDPRSAGRLDGVAPESLLPPEESPRQDQFAPAAGNSKEAQPQTARPSAGLPDSADRRDGRIPSPSESVGRSTNPQAPQFKVGPASSEEANSLVQAGCRDEWGDADRYARHPGEARMDAAIGQQGEAGSIGPGVSSAPARESLAQPHARERVAIKARDDGRDPSRCDPAKTVPIQVSLLQSTHCDGNLRLSIAEALALGAQHRAIVEACHMLDALEALACSESPEVRAAICALAARTRQELVEQAPARLLLGRCQAHLARRD